jgi:lipid-binding SYLF domain-containing protein
MTALAISTTLFGGTAIAAAKQDAKINDAIDVLHQFTAIPESAIPDALLRDAYAVAVLPGVIKVGFVAGGRFGKGLLVVRQDDGSWSNPSFVSIGGGSFGWQIGAQSTDIVLVFKDRRSIDNIMNGTITLGGEASAAAGPVGRQTSAATNGRLQAEIYSYARNRGLFAGVSLDGSWMRIDNRANAAFYGSGMSADRILFGGTMATPANADRFVRTMTAAAPRIDITTPTRRMASGSPPEIAPAAGDSATVYALEPLETLEPTESAPVEPLRDETMF